MATKLNIENLDFLLTMDAPRKRQSTDSSKVQGNREAKLTTLVTSARNDGLHTLQAASRLEGWTRVHNARVVEDVTPQMVAAMIERRAKTEREKAKAGMPFDEDYVGLTVIPSTGLKPSQNARLGGRFYIVCAPKIGDIADDVYANMVADVSDAAALALTNVRPLDTE